MQNSPSSTAELSKKLLEDPDGFLQYLNTNFDSATPNPQAMAVIEWAFFGEDPTEAKKKHSSRKGVVCGLTWGKGVMSYRCRDCQTSNSSCICLQCFEDGDHTGHDFALYPSGYGGCCDCGDAKAWKPSGNCKNHGPDKAAEAMKPLPPDTERCVRRTMAVLHAHLGQRLHTLPVKNPVPLRVLFSWLRGICKVSDTFRSLLAETLVATKLPTGTIPLLMCMFLECFDLADPVLADVVTNYILDLMYAQISRSLQRNIFCDVILLCCSHLRLS